MVLFNISAIGQNGLKPTGQNSSISKAPEPIEFDEPIEPGECTPEAPGRDGLWRFKKFETQLGNSVNYYWLGRNPERSTLESYWVGINKTYPSSVLDVHYPKNLLASSRYGLSVTTGDCNSVSLVAGDEYPSWVGSYSSSQSFPNGSPFQIRAGVASGGIWDPLFSGTFIHLNPSNQNIRAKTDQPGFDFDVNGEIHSNANAIIDNKVSAGQGASVGYGNSITTPTNGLVVNGNVGIGTTNPNAKLNVLRNSTGTNDKNEIIKLTNGFNVSSLNEPTVTFENGSNAGLINYYAWKVGAQVAGSSYFRISRKYNNNGIQPDVEYFRINDNGNVGIGINTPLSKFSVSGNVAIGQNVQAVNAPLNGLLIEGNVVIGTARPTTANPFQNWKLSVDGLINSKEVVVTPSATWGDYVFENDYKLPDLLELEKQIKRDKHLPEIPSAADVAKNGLHLGELQVVLVKKIEELTLLLIEQKKEIESLKMKVNNITGSR